MVRDSKAHLAVHLIKGRTCLKKKNNNNKIPRILTDNGTLVNSVIITCENHLKLRVIPLCSMRCRNN